MSKFESLLAKEINNFVRCVQGIPKFVSEGWWLITVFIRHTLTNVFKSTYHNLFAFK